MIWSPLASFNQAEAHMLGHAWCNIPYNIYRVIILVLGVEYVTACG